MTVTIDWPRADVVLAELLGAARARRYPYAEALALPQAFIPPEIKSNPKVHALFLFCCCHYMRGTIKSDYAVKQLVKMWEKTPEYFDPEYVRTLNSRAVLEDVLEGYLPYKKVEMARNWHENLSRLATHWQSDPRLLFAGEMTPTVLYERIRFVPYSSGKQVVRQDTHQGFYGFQKKMASMLAYFLMDAELVPYFTASPPVDFHLVRVMLATGILLPNGRKNGAEYRYEHFESRGVEVLEQYARTHGVSLVELGNSLWMLSVVLCSQAPGNRSTAVGRNEDGSKIYPVPVLVDWGQDTDVMRYGSSCARCPVESRCGLNVYAGPYYQQGHLLYRPRDRAPTVFTALFGPLRADVSPRHIRERDAKKRLLTSGPTTAGREQAVVVTQLTLALEE